MSKKGRRGEKGRGRGKDREQNLSSLLSQCEARHGGTPLSEKFISLDRIGAMILGAFLSLLLAGMMLSGCGKGAEEKKEAEAEKAPIAVEIVPATIQSIETTVMAQGTLSPAQGGSTRVGAVAAGRLISVRVKEGDTVKQGDIVAVIDNRVGQAQTRSAYAALTASEAQAKQSQLGVRALETDQANSVRLAQLSLQSAQIDRDNAIQSAETALQAAQTDLQKTQAGARPQEIALAEQAVAQAKATRDRASTEVERVQFLNDKGIAPRRQLDDANTAFSVATSAYTGAQQQLSLVLAGARTEDLRTAQLRLQQAQQTLAQAKSSGDAKVTQAQAALRQAKQAALQVDVKRQEATAARDTANQKQADLAAAQATAQYAEIHAPISGIVTRRALNPGDLADTTNPIIEITENRALNLLANLPAEYGAKVQVGMSARLTSPDLPGRTFGGRVLSVGQVDPQTNLLAVRIGVANAQNTLKLGEFVSAEIITQTLPKSVVVPKQAILNKEGKSVVFVVGADSVVHQKEVTVGSEQNGMTAIIKGIAAGDKIVRVGQYELTDGGKVNIVDKNKKDIGDAKDEAGKKEGVDKPEKPAKEGDKD